MIRRKQADVMRKNSRIIWRGIIIKMWRSYKMNAQQIKQLAYQCGADICGITTLDRFEGAPANMDPRYIMPEAKTMKM